MEQQQQANLHAYEIASQPLQYPVANLALAPDVTVAQPGPANVSAAQSSGMQDGGKGKGKGKSNGNSKPRVKKLSDTKEMYKGKTYVVRNGPNGGKYLLVKGQKHYV